MSSHSLKPGLLYFAYGCHMDVEFLSGVLGLEVSAGWPARADGWRLAFNKGGEDESGAARVASLVAVEGCCTYGVVYRLPRDALSLLDAFEEVPEHYQRTTVWVKPRDRYALQAAAVYLGQSRWLVSEGSPTKEYLDLLRRGAKRHGLPEPYIRWLESLARQEAVDCYRLATD